MATGYVTIAYGSILHGILQNILVDFKNKTTEIDFEALVRKFLVRK